MDFMNVMGVLPDIFKMFGAAKDNAAGYKIQQYSGQLAAANYRQAADITKKQSEYNVELDRQGLEQSLGSFSRDINSSLASMRNQSATTGASIGSRSFLSVTNHVLDSYQRTVTQARDANVLSATNSRYNAQVQAVDFENRAIAEDYQVKLSKFYQKRSQSDMMMKGINTLIGGLFGG